jgi:imidazolonepropionase-like amidohydrolase
MSMATLFRRAMIGMIGTLLMAGVAPAQDRTILVGSVLQPNGTIAPSMAVIISGGKVEKVVPADQAGVGPKDTLIKYDQHPGAVISPGLIDLRSAAGAMGDTLERLQPVDPNLTALDAVNPGDSFFQRALEAGITAVMIAPSENNIVGGVATTVRTRSTGSAADVLRADGPMTFTIGTSVLNPGTGPTSRAGAMTLLRDALAAAKAGKGSDRLAKVLNKQLDAIVACEAPEDVDAAARTFGEHGVKPNLILDTDAIETADDLAGSGISVVIGPLMFNSTQKSLMGPAKLAKAGIDVAFAGRTPYVEAAGLRVTAALAVRYGMDPAAARLGFTKNAAKVAGVSDKVGSLESGKDADIAVFSGDPLRLDAKVLEVYVKGARSYTRPTSDVDEAWGSETDSSGGNSHGSGN